jgi:hypothetical protein
VDYLRTSWEIVTHREGEITEKINRSLSGINDSANSANTFVDFLFVRTRLHKVVNVLEKRKENGNNDIK